MKDFLKKIKNVGFVGFSVVDYKLGLVQTAHYLLFDTAIRCHSLVAGLVLTVAPAKAKTVTRRAPVCMMGVFFNPTRNFAAISQERYGSR